MDLKMLLDNVLALGSNISIKEGRSIYKSRLVSNLSSKKIEDIYHIYSKVSEQDNSKQYSCHIKYNLKNCYFNIFLIYKTYYTYNYCNRS